MHKSVIQLQNIVSLRVLKKTSLPSTGSKHSQESTRQPTSPVVFPEKRGKINSLKQNEQVFSVNENPHKAKVEEHRVDIDEQSDLLGYHVFSGKLTFVKRSKSTGTDEPSGSGNANPASTDAKLTSKALSWGSQTLLLEDVVSVSYSTGLRHFNVHAYPLRKRSCGISCIFKPKRSQKDFCFLASSSQEAIQWVAGFADRQCFVKCSPHPMKSAKDLVASDSLFDQAYIKCKSPQRILVILNPRSGHGRSSKVFHGKVQPIFELAGFKMEVVKTTAAGHARKLAATVDVNTCPDGIVCVGGDGIVNEVLNGLLNRDDKKEAFSIPIGIIPAGSDNSLICTVLGIRDPITAALSIVKDGALTPVDVFSVEWIQTGAIHYGSTVSYFGFLSDVLELSEKYQKRFGPFRYFVAGFLKFMCLPKYSFELEYLPVNKEVEDEQTALAEQDKPDMLEYYTDMMRRSRKEGIIPRASSLSSIESIMSPSRISGDLHTRDSSTFANSEPSELVRGLDPKSKRLSSGKNDQLPSTEEVIHPQPQHHLSSTTNWPRTRSKPWINKGWSSLNTANDIRLSLAPTALNDKEDISSAISDPGPVWDVEPKWDAELTWDNEVNWDADDPIKLHVPPEDNVDLGMVKEAVPELGEKWVVKKGQFLGILVCNHSCKTVQSLSSQVVAPNAEHDDNSLDLLLVHGSGRRRLLRFFVSLQFGRHLSLPFVEYVKVKSVKLKANINTNNGCGIDGELMQLNGQVLCSLLPEQCHLIGRPARERKREQ